MARAFGRIEAKEPLNIGHRNDFIGGSEYRFKDAWQNKNVAQLQKLVRMTIFRSSVFVFILPK